MNRVLVFDIALVLLLLSPASAQKPPAEWKTLKPGLRILRLWESVGPDLPQIAILQLSSEKYKELQQNPKAFLDGYNIFYEKVRPEASLKEMLGTAGGYDGGWTVTCFHRESHGRCASYPVEPEEGKQEKH